MVDTIVENKICEDTEQLDEYTCIIFLKQELKNAWHIYMHSIICKISDAVYL